MEDDHAARKNRKDHGKREKQQRIMEAGGKRPRKESTKQHQPPATHKPSSKSKTHPRPPRHNFGRVMDQVPCRNQARYSTVSIAVPGSVVANCQTRELKTQIAGQIARAATIYHVDEIVVYDDRLGPTKRPTESSSSLSGPNAFLARLLQYCECPQYLRRHFFPVHPDLQFVGLLAPIDAPHHVRADDKCKYREGLVMEKKPTKQQVESGSVGSLVNCGVKNRPVILDTYNPGQLRGTLVSPRVLTETDGTYWGYTVRMADSLQAIWDECPYPGGYDLKIGTSERGSANVDDPHFKVCPTTYKHSLIVFGGVAGIEECVDADESLKLTGTLSHSLFHTWVNVCPYQGSRTIRTEEAVMITLAKLSPHLLRAGEKRDSSAASKQAVNDSETKSILLEDNNDVSEESSDESTAT